MAKKKSKPKKPLPNRKKTPTPKKVANSKKSKFKPIDECRTLVELFADPSRWTRGTSARNKNGVSVYAGDPAAVCFCLVGGARRVYAEKDYLGILLKIQIENPRQEPVTWFNDQNSYETVYELVKKLNI